MDYWKPIAVILLLASIVAGCEQRGDWRTASRESAGLAPPPEQTRDAVVHVYGADAWGWRGYFAIHTWIAAKRSDEDFYTVYDVIGWRGFGGRTVMGIRRDIPDRHWYGAKPQLLAAHRGPQVDELIDAIHAAAQNYPWKDTYKAYPGPNSNTFTAWIGKQVPQLQLDLPFSAIGSGFVDQAEG